MQNNVKQIRKGKLNLRDISGELLYVKAKENLEKQMWQLKKENSKKKKRGSIKHNIFLMLAYVIV